MDKMRLKFTKTGRAVYISHLDLMRTLSRAFMRAGLDLKYSEGFNPHPQISIALPLSVGTESVCELLDFRLTNDKSPDDVLTALRKQLPEGIEPVEVYGAERKVKDIRWLGVCGVFEYDDRDPVLMAERLTEFFSRESIVISKKTKRGVADSDLAPFVRELYFSPQKGAVALMCKVSAQEPTVNPELLADALRQLEPSVAPDFAAFRRLALYDGDMVEFR